MKSISLSTCLQRRFVPTRMDFTFVRHLAPLHALSLTFTSQSSSLQWLFEDFSPSRRRGKSLQTNYFFHQAPFLSLATVAARRKVWSKHKVYRADNLEQKALLTHPLASIDCSFYSYKVPPSQSASLYVASWFIVRTQSGDLFKLFSARFDLAFEVEVFRNKNPLFRLLATVRAV